MEDPKNLTHEKKPILQPQPNHHHATPWKLGEQPSNDLSHHEEPLSEQTLEQQKFREIVAKHHVQEAWARKCARQIIRRLRETQSREIAGFPHMVDSMAEAYGVVRDHYDLVYELVTECINLDLNKA
jgi:hypothetical protein